MKNVKTEKPATVFVLISNLVCSLNLAQLCMYHAIFEHIPSIQGRSTYNKVKKKMLDTFSRHDINWVDELRDANFNLLSKKNHNSHFEFGSNQEFIREG